MLVLALLSLQLLFFRCEASVLVVGATGRTGSLMYKELKERGEDNVRALVRDLTKAKEVLDCVACDASEGIFVGDVRDLTSLLPAFQGVQTVAIAAGASGKETLEEIKAIEFLGVQNAVKALAQDTNVEQFGGVQNLKVVLCSSRGTTTFSSDNAFGEILFYKLNAEVFLGSVGMVTSIVKPCGLGHSAGKNSTLVVLHDDAPTSTGSFVVEREDVARVMAELVIHNPQQNIRFDLCSIEGPATTDLGGLIESAKWNWQQKGAVDSFVARDGALGDWVAKVDALFSN